MRDTTRAAVAAVATALDNGSPIAAAYDYSAGRYATLSGTATPARVDVYIHDRGCHLSGSGTGLQFSLFHYGDGHHIDLRRTSPGRWSGYDYGGGAHFSITVNGRSASLYDYADGRWRNYTV